MCVRSRGVPVHHSPPQLTTAHHTETLIGTILPLYLCWQVASIVAGNAASGNTPMDEYSVWNVLPSPLGTGDADVYVRAFKEAGIEASMDAATEAFTGFESASSSPERPLSPRGA